MERQREACHQKGTIYQKNMFPWCFQGRLAFLDIFRNSVIKHHTASPLYNISMSLFKNYCIGTSQQNKTKKRSTSLTLHPAFDIVLIRVSMTNCNFFVTVRSWNVRILTWERKKTDINHAKRKYEGPKTILTACLFTFQCKVENRFQYNLVINKSMQNGPCSQNFFPLMTIICSIKGEHLKCICGKNYCFLKLKPRRVTFR